MLIGPSSVAGWGLFARDVILKNALIVEYVGELISQESRQSSPERCIL